MYSREIDNMNNDANKFTIDPIPAWVPPISTEEFIQSICHDKQAIHSDQDNKIYTCYRERRIVRASKDMTEDYRMLVYHLDWPELLQSAAVFDAGVQNDQRIVFHRLGVIRDSVFIDKLTDTTFRIFDNENSSSQGSITKEKKIHGIINDMRIGDIFVLEYSVIIDFSEEGCLDRQYFRIAHSLPPSNWIQKKYLFQFIHNREEDICLRKRFFRNEQGEIINEETILHKGDDYTFEKNDFQSPYESHTFSPIFEIATIASWEEISSYLLRLYQPVLLKGDIGTIETFLSSLLGDETDVEEKIRKIIEYVQDQIVYIFDAEVMHGHIPQSITETQTHQSGDCKAKSLLLVTLLREIGVQATLALINYDMGFYVPLEMPSPFVFNHIIVKILHNGNVYFVDPTWTGRLGLLEYRAQPFTPYYLEIKGQSGLQQMIQEDMPYCIEENIEVRMKKKVSTFVARTTYRFGLADNLRRAQRESSPSQRVQMETEYHLAKVQYPEDKPMTEYVANAEYTILSDDKKTNEIKDVYTATLTHPYHTGNKMKIFKYYNTFNLTHIHDMNKDAVIGSFVEFPRKVTLSISSDYVYDNSRKVTTKNLEINNNYFCFSNQKKFIFGTITVVSEFKPKTYCAIAPADLEQLKKDYTNINDSNFGIGVVYTSLLIKVRIAIILIVIVVITIIVISGLI